MKRLMLLSLLMLMTVVAQAQNPPLASRVHQEAMRKVAFLLGEWRGEGWMMMGAGDRRTFTQSETVQSKIQGTLVQIEGLGKGQLGGKGEETIIHSAYAVISYDAKAKQYMVRAYLAQGQVTDSVATVGDNSLVWGFQSGPATIRFTIKLNDKQQWSEIGEASQDGKTWHQFFEMTLNRVK
jgi:hypothetical protein